MVVTCEHCQTRFRLDDAAIPARGARVRCSRCKTSFFVASPSATREEALDEVVAESTGPGAGAPEPDEDLFDLDRTDLGVTSSDGSAAASAGGGDEQWEFDDDPPRSAASAAASRSPASAPAGEAHARSRSSSPAKPAPETSETDADIDALGDPGEWDLIGGDAEKAIREMRFVEEAPPPVRQAPAPAAAARAAEVARAARTSASTSAFAPARSFTPPSVGALANGVAWFAAIVLFAFGLRMALTPLAFAYSERAVETTFALAHGQATEVAVRRVATAFGPLAVVSGRYEPTQRSLLRVRWADEKGAAVGEGVLAGPALSEADLREVAPERLTEQLARSAEAIAMGGRFHALLPPAPDGATSAALTQEPLPTPPPPPVPPAEPGATASSPPPLLPSSE